MRNRGRRLICPKCGSSMVHICMSNDTYIYRCDRHGTVILPPDGRVRPDDPEQSSGELAVVSSSHKRS